jgi:hypothetical protein
MYQQQPMAGLAGLAGLAQTFSQLVSAPVQRFGQSTTVHKLIAVGAGAGTAYYLHKQGLADVTVAAAGIGAAYATSMVMHYPSVAGAQLPAANAAAPPALPAPGANPQADAMAEQAANVLGMGQVPRRRRRRNPGTPVRAAATAPDPMPPASGKWAALAGEG